MLIVVLSNAKDLSQRLPLQRPVDYSCGISPREDQVPLPLVLIVATVDKNRSACVLSCDFLPARKSPEEFTGDCPA